jgi:hypothetical protein
MKGPAIVRIPKPARAAVVVAMALAVGGCGTLGVKPWQREILARPEMALIADPMDAAIDDHIYFSKEASSGGRSFGGGGCGCN